MRHLSILFIWLSILLSGCSSNDEDLSSPEGGDQSPNPNQYVLTVTAGEGGSVSTQGGTYDEGTEITVTATPDNNFIFSSWDGNSSNESTITVTMNSNITLKALFEFDCDSVKLPLLDYSRPSYFNFQIIQTEQHFNLPYPIYNHVWNSYGSTAISLDYNRDGYIDYVYFENDYSNENNRQLIQFYKGDCDGNLIKDEVNSDKFYGLVHGRKVLLGDYNGDSLVDILYLGHGWDRPPFPGEYPIILFNSDSGEFTESRLTQFTSFHHGGASGDFDNDGDLDIITSTTGNDTNPHSIMYLQNDGAGNFSQYENLGPFTNNRNPKYNNLEMYDLNKDGNLDLVLLNWDKDDWNDNEVNEYSSIVIIGNNSGFQGKIYRLPRVEGWEIAYDADFFDFDGDNIDEIIITRAKNGMGDLGYYIQILQLVDNDYIDKTDTFIDTFYSNDKMWISYIEIRDYDNDGVIELRNNIPLELQLFLQESGSIQEEPYYMDEWELIGGKLIKVN